MDEPTNAPFDQLNKTSDLGQPVASADESVTTAEIISDSTLTSADYAAAAAASVAATQVPVADAPEPEPAVEESPAEVAASAAADLSSLAMPVAHEPAGSTTGVSDSQGEEAVEKGISIITREATVLGDIITEGHIDVVGKVRGNIAAQGDVAVHGQVRGDINGEKIGMYNSRVKGNLKAGQGVIVDDNSIIDGDVSTKNIIFDGKVKGNIEADRVVVLRSHSYCLGDVTAASIAVEPGAILNGTVRTLVEGDLEAPFEEVM